MSTTEQDRDDRERDRLSRHFIPLSNTQPNLSSGASDFDDPVQAYDHAHAQDHASVTADDSVLVQVHDSTLVTSDSTETSYPVHTTHTTADTMPQYTSRDVGDPTQIKKNKQSMADLKLRRLTELNNRLREDLERERIPVSQASKR